MSQSPIPARVTPPGPILKRELEARGWTQKDLAEIIGRPPQAISEIVRGAKQITPETAIELAEAFGTSAEFWTKLEANYRLHLARKGSKKEEIARKSRLYSLAPVAELVRRSWIKAADSIKDMEDEICSFLEISSPEDSPKMNVSFRMAKERDPDPNAQIAWLKRVEHLAKEQRVANFSLPKLSKAIPGLLTCATRVEDIVHVPSTLLNLGVHFLIVPHLPNTYLDGAALPPNGKRNRPVVALTLRFDRIDSFWFTLMHELAHIILGHKGIYLDNLEEQDENHKENMADDYARDYLVDPTAFSTFVKEVKPYFSKSAIERFAQTQERVPGIVLGQLQYKGIVGYQHLRPLLVKAKPLLENWIDVPAAYP